MTHFKGTALYLVQLRCLGTVLILHWIYSAISNLTEFTAVDVNLPNTGNNEHGMRRLVSPGYKLYLLGLYPEMQSVV